MEQPLLWAEDKLDQAKELDLPTSRCHRPITTDIGEVNRSDQTQGGSSVEEPCQTQWVRVERKHHTCAADGFAPYDPAKKRKDNTLLLRRLREKPVFFRKNVPTNAHAALQEACLGNAPGHDMETTNSLGIALVFVSTIFYSCASVFVKLNSDMPSVESGCIRSIYSVVFGSILTHCLYRQQLLPFEAGSAIVALLVARGFVDFAASNLFYLGCTELGLGLATVLMFTNPFWAAAIAKLWVGQSYSILDFALSCFAFMGVLLSAMPSFKGGRSSTAMPAIVFCVLLGSIFQALTYCFIKRISHHVHFMQMTVAYGICGVALGPCIMTYGVISQNPLVEPAPVGVLKSPKVLMLSLCLALSAIGAQIFLNLGCARIDSSMAALIRTLDIPLSLILQHFIFGKVPQVGEVVGASIVTMACITLTVLKQINANMVEDAEEAAAKDAA